MYTLYVHIYIYTINSCLNLFISIVILGLADSMMKNTSWSAEDGGLEPLWSTIINTTYDYNDNDTLFEDYGMLKNPSHLYA